MYKFYLLIFFSLFLAGCSKESDEIIDNSPIALVYFTVSDSDGNDLLDVNSPLNIFNPDLLEKKSHPMLDDCYKYKYIYGIDKPTELWPSQPIEMINGKYALYFHMAPIQRSDEKITVEFQWKDGVEPDVFDIRLYGLPNNKEYLTLNGVQIKRIDHYKFHHHIVK